MRARGGFTLIEVIVSLAVGALLVGGVYAVFVDTSRTAEGMKKDASLTARRARAVEILREDFLGSAGDLKIEANGERAWTIRFPTTADGFAPAGRLRGVAQVTYEASGKGLIRRERSGEGAVELILLEEPADFRFLEDGAWGDRIPRNPVVLKLVLSNPPLEAVIRVGGE